MSRHRPGTCASQISTGPRANRRFVWRRQKHFDRVRSNPTEDADIKDFSCGFSTMRCGRPSRAALTIICSGTALRYWALVCSGTGDSRSTKSAYPSQCRRRQDSKRRPDQRHYETPSSRQRHCHGVSHLRQQNGRRHLSGVPAALATLYDKCVRTQLHRFHCMFKAPTVGIHTMPAALKRAMVAASGERL